MNVVTRPTASLGGASWAARTLKTLLIVVIGALGITTLNGYAASGFSRVPNPFMEIFGSVIEPLPKAPPGYQAVTPGTLQTDFSQGKNRYLGQQVSVYGKLLPWGSSASDPIMNQNEAPPVKPLSTRPGTVILALYLDPEEHPDASSHPVTVTVRISEDWKQAHSGIQNQWVQALGTVVAYNPGGGQPQPEVQATDIRVIPEPYDIFDHGIPLQNPMSED